MFGHDGSEERKCRWQQAVARRLKCADPQDAGVSGSHRVEVGLRRGEAGDDVAGVIEQHLARLRQRHRAGSARPVHQPMSDGLFERRDLLRDGALRIAQSGGGLRERTGLATASNAIRWRTSTPRGRSNSEIDFSIYIYFPY